MVFVCRFITHAHNKYTHYASATVLLFSRFFFVILDIVMNKCGCDCCISECVFESAFAIFFLMLLLDITSVSFVCLFFLYTLVFLPVAGADVGSGNDDVLLLSNVRNIVILGSNS